MTDESAEIDFQFAGVVEIFDLESVGGGGTEDFFNIDQQILAAGGGCGRVGGVVRLARQLDAPDDGVAREYEAGRQRAVVGGIGAIADKEGEIAGRVDVCRERLERVVALAAKGDVVAFARRERIFAIAADEEIVALAAGERVRSVSADEDPQMIAGFPFVGPQPESSDRRSPTSAGPCVVLPLPSSCPQLLTEHQRTDSQSGNVKTFCSLFVLKNVVQLRRHFGRKRWASA